MTSDQLDIRAQLLMQLWICSAQLGERIDNSLGAVHGIAFIEFMVLHQLAAAPDGAMRRVDLARAVSRSASGVTRLLRPMEKIGLVAKGESQRDARVSLVQLTAAGRERYKDASATMERLGERLTDRLDAPGVAGVMHALADLAA